MVLSQMSIGNISISVEGGRYTYILSCRHGGRKERDDWKQVLERIEEGHDSHHTLRDKCHIMRVKDHLWGG